MEWADPEEGIGGSVPTSIFQTMGFCNGKICWTTPGLKVVPPEKIFWIRACMTWLLLYTFFLYKKEFDIIIMLTHKESGKKNAKRSYFYYCQKACFLGMRYIMFLFAFGILTLCIHISNGKFVT